MTSRIRVLVVDDHPLLRIGLATLFRTVDHIEVVGEAKSAREAVALARRVTPDVVLLDVRLPDGTGVEACREIRSARPQTRVLMLTSYADDQAVVASLIAGAAGYLLKQTEPERLIEAVESVASGGSLLDPAVTETVLRWMRREETAPGGDVAAGLSVQQRKMLPLIAAGKTNREIAVALSLTESTVKTYVSSILQKLQVARRAELAAFFARQERPDDG
jgi:DNA-binding NarL/FixJ family response regulator